MQSLERIVGGRYRIAERLGQGAHGVVHRAVDTLTGREVAVKILDAAAAPEPSVEISLLRGARLPGVARWLADGTHDGHPFLVMELAVGAPFPGVGRRRWSRMAPAVRSLLRVLARLHAHQIVHGDIKPDNVLVDWRGRVTLLDFSVAARTSLAADAAATGRWRGTRRYLAPERLLGAPPAPTSDLYAVGVMLYETLSGAPPFPDYAAPASVGVRLTRSPPSLVGCRGVPRNVAAVVSRLLSADPEDRPASAAAASRALLPPREGGADPAEARLQARSAAGATAPKWSRAARTRDAASTP